MLTSTFKCFDGIGEDAENRLWITGCMCWRDFRNGAGNCFSIKKQEHVLAQIRMAETAHATAALYACLSHPHSHCTAVAS